MPIRASVLIMTALAVLPVTGSAAQVPMQTVDLRAAVRAAAARAASESLALTREIAPASSDWARVEQLDGDVRVRIVERTGRETTGRVARVTGDTISIAAAAGLTTFERSHIDRVQVASLTKRLVYGSIGAAGGVIGGFLLCPSCINEGNPELVHRLAATLGTAGSLLFLVPRESTIYRAPKVAELSR